MSLPFVTNMAGPLNVFVPSFQGKQQARLITSFARDPKKFAVNGLTTRTPTDVLAGLWLQLRPEALARVLTDPNAVVWVDGQPFPSGTHNQQDFRSVPYTCIRRAHPDYVGWQTKDQAVWPILETKVDALAHIMMTHRTSVFYTLMLTTANHLASHVKTATAWSNIGGTGGFWSTGTGENPVIKRTMLNVADQIRKDTIGTVQYKDLSLVIDPTAAVGMATTEELHWYLGQSPYAKAQVRGDEPSQNGTWGLPDTLYGMNLVVDPTVQTVTGRMVVPGTYSDLMTANTALFLAAPGALKENLGQVNSGFSTTHMFVYKGEEMVTKTQDFPWDQLTKLGIYETYDMKIVSQETTALATNLFS